MSKSYTVCAGFYDCDSRATVTVEAASYEEACEKACALIDDGEVSTDSESWDATRTFVMGLVEGEGDPWDGCANVPATFADPLDQTRVESAAADLLKALRAVLPYAESRLEDMEEARRDAYNNSPVSVWRQAKDDCEKARSAFEAAQAAIAAAEGRA